MTRQSAYLFFLQTKYVLVPPVLFVKRRFVFLSGRLINRRLMTTSS